MNPHPHPSLQQAAQRSLWLSVVVNVVLTLLQIVTGLWAGSQALVADALHSLSDLIADFVALLARRHSHKAPDDDHHYGHQRYETAASLALGLLLLGAGVSMLLGAGNKITSATPLAPVHQAALWVALLTLLSKELLFRYMLKIASEVKSSMLVANAWHARADAASSLVVALGIAGNLAGYTWLDPLAAALVGFMVGKTGWGFAWDALHDLMDRAADADTVAAIRATLLATPGVQGVHDLRTRRMADQIQVDVHLEIDGNLTVHQGHDIAAAARLRVMSSQPVLDVMTHIDPV
ncbi:cation diffusion facilitator family transporter [Vogesella indigofera]|uniref:Cation diffusion facilitator family transporter n=1 Tax=Vogesella indigofera TaxID=45465 RepID=A0ABT5I0Y0_VOGIN|nr:cation diffusion facilitator family transporter [Vogesella indigofera]MDC7689759.1 cation diffusion facilitator family transporter [Vogesella indigofera]